MSRYRCAALLRSGALLVAGCSEKAETLAEKKAAASVPGAPPGGAADIAAKAATASKVEEKTDLIEFSYSYPAEAARIPGLAAWLDSDRAAQRGALVDAAERSEEHTSELQSLMRISYAVICLKKTKNNTDITSHCITIRIYH